MNADQKVDEKTLPLVEIVFSFVVRNLKVLGAFGGCSFAVIVVLWFLLPRLVCTPVPAEKWVRAAWLPGFFNGQISECERALSAYAVAYDALKRNGASEDAVSMARQRLEVLVEKGGILRAAKKRFFALPRAIDSQPANANDVIYSDSEEGVNVSLGGCYEKVVTPPEKDNRKRTLLAGWVCVNALFAVFLAGWNWRKGRILAR